MAANFEIETVTIKMKTGEFTVRGMNSEDIVFMSQTYWDDVTSVVAKYGKKTGGVVPKSNVAELVLDLAKDFPSMAAEIISRCADAPEQVDKFRRLPFVKQIEALKAIATLSTEDGHELKKWALGLVSLLETKGLLLGPQATQLQTIISKSENQ